VAPTRALRRTARMATELAIAAGPALVIVCLPLPRYVLMPCCNDDTHIDNFDTAGYKAILRSGQTAVKEALEEAMARVLYLDPLVAFGDSPLREMSTVGGDLIWCEDDAVHLTPAAYGDVMAVVIGL
jgi:hypothetical protein